MMRQPAESWFFHPATRVVVMSFCVADVLFVCSQEDITSGSGAEMMSLLWCKKESLQGSGAQLLRPRSLIWKSVTCDWRHRLLPQFPGAARPLLPSCINTPSVCILREGFEKSRCPFVWPNRVTLCLSPSTGDSLFWLYLRNWLTNGDLGRWFCNICSIHLVGERPGQLETLLSAVTIVSLWGREVHSRDGKGLGGWGILRMTSRVWVLE